ncbi:MAG: putative Phospho-N-acetylmuramoyl-pentapeptide-transferase [Deltaproteobacteria bacterium]|nr:putative Phospho-N-acetylmuramoyl-pentapeptide-transferase [Deltaproteobacteria bacterium]
MMPSGVGFLAPAAALLLSLLMALYLTPIFRDAARQFGIVDSPDGQLKTQKDSVPYLGGVAVFAAVLFPVSLFLQLSDKVSGLLLASSVIVLLGLIDDIGRLSPRVKLLVQVTAVFLMMKSGIRIRIAAGVATVSALALAVVFLLQGNRMGLILCLSLVGALLGFLRYNRPPAQIYLGDTGSLLIGFLLGGLAIEGDYTARNPYGWFTALAVFAVPLFEIVFVSWLRFRRGASILSGSRDHFSLRLRRWKLTRGQTVSASCVAAAVASAVGLLGIGLAPLPSLFAYGSIGLLFLVVAMWLKTIDMGL